MIPNHILNEIGSEEFIAVFARKGELHFLVHTRTVASDVFQTYADRDGSEIVATHLRDPDEILALVAGRERDLGGEG
jgi:hypothetical protein